MLNRMSRSRYCQTANPSTSSHAVGVRHADDLGSEGSLRTRSALAQSATGNPRSERNHNGSFCAALRANGRCSKTFLFDRAPLRPGRAARAKTRGSACRRARRGLGLRSPVACRPVPDQLPSAYSATKPGFGA
jgi:hypothetical protein